MDYGSKLAWVKRTINYLKAAQTAKASPPNIKLKIICYFLPQRSVNPLGVGESTGLTFDSIWFYVPNAIGFTLDMS